MKIHKVLIPLDGSELSRQIVPYVQRLFSPVDTELILLRVTERPEGLVANPPRPVTMAWAEPFHESRQDIGLAGHPMYASQVWENVRSAAEQDLLPDEHVLKEAGYTVSVLIEDGDVMRTIVDVAEREAVDLVAMTTHCRTGLRRLVLGSVAEATLHELTVPLLLMHPVEHPVDDRETEDVATAVC
jgi:nucleotide-binding universal stress UspA family protein